MKLAVRPTPLQKRIFVLVVCLLTLVFSFTFFSVYNAAYKQSQSAFAKRLDVGKNVFENEILVAQSHLDSSVETIAKDWALRKAIGQGIDELSILSILDNHSRRIDANIALILDREGKPLFSTNPSISLGIKQAGALIKEFSSQQIHIAWFNGELYLMSANSINSPTPKGWLIIGKKINAALLQRTKALISLDISVAVITEEGIELGISTLTNGSAAQTLASPSLIDAISAQQVISIEQSDEPIIALPFALKSSMGEQIVVVLQDSSSASLSGINPFLIDLTPFFATTILLSILGSIYVAQSISRPVSRLLEAVKQVTGGQYSEELVIPEKGELSELAKEFSAMKNAVSEREFKIRMQAKELAQSQKIKLEANVALQEKQLAEEAARAKSNFIASISHEVRTPLNSIVGYTEILSEDGLHEREVSKAIRAINTSTKHLLSIINDVLDLSKIDAGKIELEALNTNLISLIADVCAFADPPARKKGLDFRVDWSFPLPSHVVVDPTRLKQILINLCSNAVKFTTYGWVEIKISCDESTQTLRFTVADTGAGISQLQQDKLFNAFTQADQTTSRKYGGTGLGLYISKQLAQLMKGDITVESALENGSKFYVEIPWVKSTLKGTDNGNSVSWVNNEFEAEKVLEMDYQSELLVPHLDAEILCADDNEDNRNLMLHLISKTGARTTLAEDGMQALAYIEQHHYDLILMDMQMPVMDGIETTSKIKALGTETPVIMVTANTDASSKARIMDCGADEHFPKPIEKRRFYELLSRYLSEHNAKFDEGSNSHVTPHLTTQNDAQFDELVHGYLSRLESKMQDLYSVINMQDWQSVQVQLHRLKGSAGSYGFRALSELAESFMKRIQPELDAANEVGSEPRLTVLASEAFDELNAESQSIQKDKLVIADSSVNGQFVK